MASWRQGTHKKYGSYLERWKMYCLENDISLFQPEVQQIVEFLTNLYKQGLGYSAINTARSVLSATISQANGLHISEHPSQIGLEDF